MNDTKLIADEFKLAPNVSKRKKYGLNWLIQDKIFHLIFLTPKQMFLMNIFFTDYPSPSLKISMYFSQQILLLITYALLYVV